MKLVVAAVDGSAMSLVALRYGAEIAARAGAQIRAVYVRDEKLLSTSLLSEAPVHDRVETAVEAEGRETLSRARDIVGRLGLTLETSSRRGVVPLILVEEAGGADLLTMGRWGGNALWATGMLGSAVECVVRKVGRPVLVASGPYHVPRRIVVPFDGSEGARKALDQGGEAATLFGVPLVLLTVEKSIVAAAVQQEEAERLVRASGCEAPIQRLVYKGERSAEIASEADEGTLTYMGAYGHSPMRELILGSVTAQVMRMAKGAVVLCR